MQLEDDRRIRGFDGVRAIAFLLVFISHKSALPHRDTYGAIGVLTFFVLSGLLITRILTRARMNVEGGETSPLAALKRFYVRRTARIFPVYYGLIAFFFIASQFVHFDGFEKGAPLAFLLFGTNIYVSTTGHWVGHFGHFWTLAIEEQFYLLLAPLILFSPRAATARICIAFMAVALAVKIGLELAGASDLVIGLNSFIAFGFLGLGGLVGLSLDRRPPRWLVSPLAQAASGLALIAVAAMIDLETWGTYGEAACILAGLLIFQIAQNQGSSVVAFLESWPLRSLGRISYGAYLFHEFVHFYNLQQAAAKLGFDLEAPLVVQLAVELALTVAIATASWRFLERPIIALAARATPKPAQSVGEGLSVRP